MKVARADGVVAVVVVGGIASICRVGRRIGDGTGWWVGGDVIRGMIGATPCGPGVGRAIGLCGAEII
jgi:hypothetical protein